LQLLHMHHLMSERAANSLTHTHQLSNIILAVKLCCLRQKKRMVVLVARLADPQLPKLLVAAPRNHPPLKHRRSNSRLHSNQESLVPVSEYLFQWRLPALLRACQCTDQEQPGRLKQLHRDPSVPIML